MSAVISPPALALWLLKRVSHDSLVGDLCEQFQRRRSAAWFWRQAAIAIVLACYQDIRTHKWLAARAVLTYAVSVYVIQLFLYLTVGNLYTSLVRSHPQYGWALFLLVGAMIPSFIQGWLVARLHRPYQLSMTVVVLVAILLAQGPEFARRSGNAVEDPRYVSALVDFINTLVVYVFGLLAGALTVRPPEDTSVDAACMNRSN